MIREILVRYFTPEYEALHQRLAEAIRAETDFAVQCVDHTGLTLADFELGGAPPVSIDRHLADKFAIPYVQISRRFRLDGEVASRHVCVPPHLPAAPCILDTDVVHGETLALARRLLRTERYSVRLVVEPHQDLIDVEDLALPNSLFVDGVRRSYLCNAEVFARRTSLPQGLYGRICELVRPYAREHLAA